MKTFFIIGPQAVGKMAVGEALAKKTNLPLLFNHMTLDILAPFLGWTEEMFDFSNDIRMRLVDEMLKQEDNPGLIMTFVMEFDGEKDAKLLSKWRQELEEKGAEIYLIELETDLKTRLERNEHEYRLSRKPSKRDVEYSKNNLLKSEKEHRLNSLPNEVTEIYGFKKYLRLDNTKLSPDETAQKILDYFKISEAKQ
jgi:hypothetical protein